MCAKGSAVASGKKAMLVAEDGTTQQLDISIDGITGSFPGISLAAGHTYTLTIPSGAIIAPDNVANQENVSATFLTPAVFDGDYYLYMPTLEAFLGRGGDYGTRAVTDKYGTPVHITTTTSGATRIKYFVGDAYLGSDGFTDKSADYEYVAWAMQPTTDGFVLRSDNGYYLEMYEGNRARVDAATADEATHLTAITSARRQAIIEEAAMANQAMLTADHQKGAVVNVIKAAQSGSTKFWALEEPELKMNASENAYNVGSYGGELYLKHGTVSQTVTVPHAGLYKLSLTALYRQGTNEECYAWGQAGFAMSNAYVSINDSSHAMIPDWYSCCTAADSPNTALEAQTLMRKGKYATELFAYIGEEMTAKITIHVPAYVAGGWCLFGNFQLTEYVDSTSVGINSASEKVNEQVRSESLYNLSGQRVGDNHHGIVIQNGKKYIKQ